MVTEVVPETDFMVLIEPEMVNNDIVLAYILLPHIYYGGQTRSRSTHAMYNATRVKEYQTLVEETSQHNETRVQRQDTHS